MFHNEGLSYGQVRDEYYIARGFRDLGLEVFQNDESQLPNVDLVLCFKSRYGIDDLRRWKTKTKAPFFVFTFDNMDRFPEFYPFIKECNLWLGEELGRADRFRQEELPFYYFPYHAVPEDIFKKVDSAKLYDVVFTGTPYDGDYKPDKFELLRAVQMKHNLFVWGNNPDGWRAKGIQNVFEPAFDENLSYVYGQSKIVLALSNTQCEGYWSIRTTQALMCGAFVLARYTPQMEKELKDNVVYYDSISDCLDKIEKYLADSQAREEIAKRGYEYAKKYLTVTQRLKELIILYEQRNDIPTFKRY